MTPADELKIWMDALAADWNNGGTRASGSFAAHQAVLEAYRMRVHELEQELQEVRGRYA